MPRRDIGKYLARETVSQLRGFGIGESTLRLMGEDSSTINYFGYWLDIFDNSKEVRIILEKGENLERVADELSKILSAYNIEEKDSEVVVNRELVRNGDSRYVSLSLSKVNDKEKIFHSFYRAGIKPILRAITQVRQL